MYITLKIIVLLNTTNSEYIGILLSTWSIDTAPDVYFTIFVFNKLTSAKRYYIMQKPQ